MLSNHVMRYVDLHQKLGLRFDAQRRILERYARYAMTHGDRHIRISRLQEWCATASSSNRARTWFDTVRRFCTFLNAEDPLHEIPPANMFGRGKRRRPAPHILEPEQIRAIVIAALDLPPKDTVNPQTYSHLFGLLSATGLRISEALALQRQDVTDDGLIIRYAKFGKRRLVPIHATTRQALKDYVAIRNRLGGDGDDLFVVCSGRVPNRATVCRIFLQLARKLGFRGIPGTPGPRLHDLRHTFAARSLETCAHDRMAVSRHMATLSTYLGHSSIAHTYWYLEATPVLLHKIAEVNEALFEGGAA